jgi:hypothetical protein
MPFEQAIDTGLDSDQPLAGHSVGLRFDHAWFVSHLDASDPQNGTATVDVRTLARPTGKITPARTQGTDPGTAGGAPASAFDQQDWQLGPRTATPQNALSAQLAGASRVTLDLRGMGLTIRRPLLATIDTDAQIVFRLKLPQPACIISVVDGTKRLGPRTVRVLATRLPRGHHRIKLRPARHACHARGDHIHSETVREQLAL